MELLYSYKGAYPYPLPKNMKGYDINDFMLAGAKPELSPGQFLDWSGTDWVVRNANQAEIDFKWVDVRIERNKKLADSDVYVIRAYENGEPVSENIKVYRQALRDVTQQPDPFNIVWPIL